MVYNGPRTKVRYATFHDFPPPGRRLLTFTTGSAPVCPYEAAPSVDRTLTHTYARRMAVQRLRVMQEKQAALAKAARREIAQLLERGRTETARIKVEGLIGDDIHVELLELMELYCELLIARFALLDMCPPNRDPDAAVAEGVAAVVHAAPRTELKGPSELCISSAKNKSFSLR